ncbi:MAG: DUF1846 family protein, partial [Clostridia bacterium]|nr:DUF1846 family protein [Clostridia bacterium]
MFKIGFDNEKYLKMQSEHIQERIKSFGGKLYLEFGGKLFDDFHASRVLPGFAPESKIHMLMKLKDQAEIVIVVSAEAIEQNKMRADLGITYDMDAIRLIDAFTEIGLYEAELNGKRVGAFELAPGWTNYKKRLQVQEYDVSAMLKENNVLTLTLG